jgi:hypothetical protein
MAKEIKQYLEIHQSRSAEPTEYENLFAEGLERSYAVGIQDLEGLVANLNELCVPVPAGKSWTVDLLKHELRRLGA